MTPGKNVTPADRPETGRWRAVCDALLCTAGFAVLVPALWLALRAPGIFVTQFAQEDGPVEYATAVLLLFAAALSYWRWRADPVPGWPALALALALVFGFGEELSWGQRIFGWQTGGFFADHNRQGETNLHNLVVGGHHLARLLFGNLLSAVLLAYFLLLPLLCRWCPGLHRRLDRRALPVPAPRHALLILAGCAVMLVLPDTGRKWEVLELVFAIAMTGTLLRPARAPRDTAKK